MMFWSLLRKARFYADPVHLAFTSPETLPIPCVSTFFEKPLTASNFDIWSISQLVILLSVPVIFFGLSSSSTV